MKKLFFFALLLLTGGTLCAQVVTSGIAPHYSDSVFYISEQGGFHPSLSSGGMDFICGKRCNVIRKQPLNN